MVLPFTGAAVRDFVNDLWPDPLEQLPGYALTSIPSGRLWQHLKHVELRNVITRTWKNYTWNTILPRRIRQKCRLIDSFFQDALMDKSQTET